MNSFKQIQKQSASQGFNKWAKYYDQKICRYHQELRIQALTNITKDIKNHLELKFLEIALGTGEMFSHLLPLMKFGYGLDQSSEMIKIAQNRLDNLPENQFNYELIIGDATDLPFENDSLDLIFASEVLQYLNEFQRSKLFFEMYRIIKPRGKIILINWNGFWEFLQKIRRILNIGVQDTWNVSYPSVSNIKNLAVGSGLKVNNFHSVASLFYCPNFLSRFFITYEPLLKVLMPFHFRPIFLFEFEKV